MAPRITTTARCFRPAVGIALLASLLSAGSSQAYDARYDGPAPVKAIFPAPTAPGMDGDSLAVGGMLVHLDNFVELRDGSVRAELSFHNPTTRTTAFTGPKASRADQIGTLVSALQEPTARLTNAEGRHYRLVELSQFGDTQTRADWISVPPGGSAVLTAIFLPEGAVRGAQPFALAFPIRESWAPADAGSERTSRFEINFKGLHRPTDTVRAAPVPHVERVSLPSAAPLARAAEEPSLDVSFNDDVGPIVAKLPTPKPDARHYLIAIGIDKYDDAPAVPFADRSARTMTNLLRKLYGIPDENITLITGLDATGTKMTGRINSLIQRLTPGDTVFFYYAGHGLSARDGSAVYIVPRDAVPGAYEVDSLSLGSLLHRFETSKASHVVAFLDTCFSGRVSRDKSLFPGTAPLVPVAVPTTPVESSGKVTVFLASQADQFANDLPERGHRLFSYYVMQGLIAGYNNASDLETFVAREVRRASAKRGSDFVQEPRLEGVAQGLPNRLIAGPRRSVQAN